MFLAVFFTRTGAGAENWLIGKFFVTTEQLCEFTLETLISWNNVVFFLGNHNYRRHLVSLRRPTSIMSFPMY
jgi:hypothetical protein